MPRPLAIVIRRPAPAEHAVQLADAGAQPVRTLHRDVAERTWPALRQRGSSALGREHGAFLYQRDQLTGCALAVRAGARLGTRESALLATVDAAVAGPYLFSGEAAGLYLPGRLSPCSPSRRTKNLK